MFNIIYIYSENSHLLKLKTEFEFFFSYRKHIQILLEV